MKILITAVCLVLVTAASALAQCNSSCTLNPPAKRIPLQDWRFINDGNLPQFHGYPMKEDTFNIQVENGGRLNLSSNEIEIVLKNVPSIDWKKEIVAFNACTGRGTTIATQGSNNGPVRMRITRNGTSCSADTVILRKEKAFQGMVDMYHLDPARFWRLWAGKIVTFTWVQDFVFGPDDYCAFPCVPVTTDPNAGILYDTDSKADIGVWRPLAGTNSAFWAAINSSTGLGVAKFLGKPNDIPVPFDYDGDGRTDMAVWRPDTGEWLIINSLTGQLRTVQWGMFGDQPAPGDFDGDGKVDLAVWRPTSGLWFIKGYITGAEDARVGDAIGDLEAVGNYDGDHKTDFGLWSPSVSIWKIFITDPPRTFWWGAANGIHVPADYDGDGATDFIVFKDGTWYIKLSNASGTQSTVSWGVPGDVPVPQDYDGDGKADLTVFRPWTSEWWILKSSDNSNTVVLFGGQGDVPVPSK